MSSSDTNQFSMEYIEVINGENRRWKIDGSPFEDWVTSDSEWMVLKEETRRLQLVFPGKRKYLA